jgi:hypothetical protein
MFVVEAVSSIGCCELDSWYLIVASCSSSEHGEEVTKFIGSWPAVFACVGLAPNSVG